MGYETPLAIALGLGIRKKIRPFIQGSLQNFL